MRGAAKAAVVVLPFLLAFVALRACSLDEARRWQSRVADIDPQARVAVDDERLIVIAPEEEWGRAAAAEVQRFRSALVGDYGDLIGRGRDQRMVVVLFSSGEHLREYAGQGMPFDAEWVGQMHGYTDARQGAIFIPPGSSPATLRHETVHWVVATSHDGLVRFSPWLNEGLAQLFENYEPGAKPPGIGEGDRWRVRTLLPADTLDVDRLLELEEYRDFVVENGHRNYLEALVLTAFLFERRERAQLKRYLDAERASPDGRALAFQRIYAHDSPQFRRDLRAYIAHLKFG